MVKPFWGGKGKRTKFIIQVHEKTCPAVKGSLSYVQKSSTQLRRGCEKLHNILRLHVVESYFKVTDQEDENLHSFEDDRPTSERLDDEAFL